MTGHTVIRAPASAACRRFECTARVIGQRRAHHSRRTTVQLSRPTHLGPHTPNASAAHRSPQHPSTPPEQLPPAQGAPPRTPQTTHIPPVRRQAPEELSQSRRRGDLSISVDLETGLLHPCPDPGHVSGVYRFALGGALMRVGRHGSLPRTPPYALRCVPLGVAATRPAVLFDAVPVAGGEAASEVARARRARRRSGSGQR